MPNVKNIRPISGWGYCGPVGAARVKNFGHLQRITKSIEITTEPVWVSGTGVKVKGDVMTTEASASGMIELRETDMKNLAFAVAGDLVAYTQEAITDQMVSVMNGKKGELIDLGALNVTISSIMDGIDPIPATAYEVDAKAGTIELKEDVTEAYVTFDAPAIIEDEGRTMVNILSRPEGITCTLIVIEKTARSGKRAKWVFPQVVIRPDGDLTLVQEDQTPVTYTLSYEVIADMTKPEGQRFGQVYEIDA